MKRIVVRQDFSSQGSLTNLSRLHAEKQKSYVERYKDAFKEDPQTAELPQLLKANEYLRECLRDLNSLISKKIDKQKEKIFSRYQKEELAPKKSESQIIEEQLTLLERDYSNNNFIFTQQERELRQLDERLSGISSTQHFELVGQIESLNDEIRRQRMECNSQKYFNFKEGKYLDSNSQLPKIVEIQQNTSLDALKLQRENERIKDLAKKKEDLMMEYAKKIQIVDKKYKIASSKQFEEIDVNLAKKIAEEKKKAESLQNNIDIVIKNYEREQLKNKQVQKDISLVEKHTDDKVNALELQIRQLNADIQQLQDLAKEVAPNQQHPSFSQTELKLSQNQDENEKQPRVTPLKPTKPEVVEQSTHKEIESSSKKKIPSKLNGNKNNPEPISIPVKQTKPKAEMHSVSIQQTPTDQKQQGEQQKFFPSQNQPKNQKQSEEDDDEKDKITKAEINNDKNDFEDNDDNNEKLDNNSNKDDQDNKQDHHNDLDDSAIFNPKNKQNDKHQTHNKLDEQEDILGSQVKQQDQHQTKDKEDNEDDENLDDIEAEIRQLEQQEEEQKQQNQNKEKKEEHKQNEVEQLNHKEQMKLQPLNQVKQKVSSDSQTGGQHSENKVMIPNKGRESINKIDDKMMQIEDHEKSNQESNKNSQHILPNESKNEIHSKNELKSQIIYNESSDKNQGLSGNNIKEIENKKEHEQVSKTKLMPLQGINVPNKTDSKLNTQKDLMQEKNHESDIDIDDLLDDNNATKQQQSKQQPSVKQIPEKQQQQQQQSGANNKTEHQSQQQQQQHQKEETKQNQDKKDIWEELSDF